MPEVGEIRSGYSLGYKVHCAYVWLACKECGKERWVRRREAVKPTYHGLCKACSYRSVFTARHNSLILQGRPYKHASELGFRTRSYLYQDFCPNCSKEMWRQRSGLGTLCRACSKRLKQSKRMTGEGNPRWKGGRTETGQYIHIQLLPDDPYYSMANKHGYVLEHRIIMARHLGRSLNHWEIVHHINQNKKDNRLENLRLLPSSLEHAPLTKMEARIIQLEQKVLLLEADNVLLRKQLDEMAYGRTQEQEEVKLLQQF